MAEPDRPEGATITEATASELLGISPRMLRHLVGEGWIPRRARGRYGLVETVQGYIRYRRDLERREEAREASDVELRRVRRREIEQRIERRDAQLIDINEHRALFDEALGVLALEAAKLPPRVPREIRREVKAEIAGILERARRRFDAATATLVETGRAPAPGGLD